MALQINEPADLARCEMDLGYRVDINFALWRSREIWEFFGNCGGALTGPPLAPARKSQGVGFGRVKTLPRVKFPCTYKS